MSSFEPTCEATCDCVRNKFSPICGADGKTYFSACHAGCSNYTIVDGKVASVSTTDIDRYLEIFSGYPLRGGEKKKKKEEHFSIYYSRFGFNNLRTRKTRCEISSISSISLSICLRRYSVIRIIVFAVSRAYNPLIARTH